jgi:CheY-like chemotaxis protein
MMAQHILAVVQSDLQLICALRRVLEGNGVGTLTVARNSQEAILYLRGVGIYENRKRYPVPSVAILDCQSPNGADLEVLGWIRERGGFGLIPVILLCSEQHAPFHVSCALDPGSYLVDRQNLDDLIDAVRNIESSPHSSGAAFA